MVLFGAETAWQGFLLGFALSFLRAATAFMSISPLRIFLGAAGIGSLSGTGALLCLSRAAASEALGGLPGFVSPSTLAAAALWNILVGLTVGAPVGIVLQSLPMAFRLIDTLRGSQYAEQILPGSEARTSPLETAAQLGAALLFFQTGAVRLLLAAIADPPVMPGAAGASRVLPDGNTIAGLAGDAFRRAIGLAAPLAVLLLLLEVAAAVCSRLGHRLPFGTELVGIRLLVGLGGAWLIARELLPGWLDAAGPTLLSSGR